MPCHIDQVSGGVDPMSYVFDQVPCGAVEVPSRDELRANVLRIGGGRGAVSRLGRDLSHARGGEAVNRFA